jgi:hypothetical protein
MLKFQIWGGGGTVNQSVFLVFVDISIHDGKCLYLSQYTYEIQDLNTMVIKTIQA